jgi:hypothetical protein
VLAECALSSRGINVDGLPTWHIVHGVVKKHWGIVVSGGWLGVMWRVSLGGTCG